MITTIADFQAEVKLSLMAQVVSNLTGIIYNPDMDINKTLGNILAATAVVLVLAFSAAGAEEKSSLSVGHDALSILTDNPKSKAVGALTGKYDFSISKELQPYLGTGVAYSIPHQGGSAEAVPGIRTGFAGQAGINYQLGGSFSLNIDYKYIKMSPEAAQGGKEPAAQKVGVGLDIKF